MWDSFGEDWDAVIAMEVAMGLRGIGANPLSRRGSGASLTPSQPTDRLPFQQENSLRYGELTDRPAFSDDEAHAKSPGSSTAIGSYSIAAAASARLAGRTTTVRSRIRAIPTTRRRPCKRPSCWLRARLPSSWPAGGASSSAHRILGSCCAGAIWLKGEAARKAHLKWAGVPRALIRKWTSQRRRRSRTVRKLVELAPAEQPVPAA